MGMNTTTHSRNVTACDQREPAGRCGCVASPYSDKNELCAMLCDTSIMAKKFVILQEIVN